MQIQISNNPYKYIQEDDESKYFFLISQMNGQDSLNIIKLREKEVILNELNLVERYDNEYMKVKFPKVNEERVIAFIQYFNTINFFRIFMSYFPYFSKSPSSNRTFIFMNKIIFVAFSFKT